MEYLKLFKSLSDAGVKYLLCGGVAVNIYGIPRMTADIDIIVELTEDNVNKFEASMTQLGYRTSIPVKLRDLCDKTYHEKLIKGKNLHAVLYSNDNAKYM
ncbi:MAG: hypothetical protein ACRDFC_06440, partial [Ignavibacteria bacterium]